MSEKCMGGPAPAPTKTAGLMLKMVPDDDPKTIPVGVRVAHALSSAALETNDPEVLSALGGLVALVPALPAIQQAAADGLDRLVGSVVMPTGKHVTVNGLDITNAVRRMLDVPKEPKRPKGNGAKAPAPKVAPRPQPKRVAR